MSVGMPQKKYLAELHIPVGSMHLDSGEKMQQVPGFWVWVSGIYFVLSILWNVGLAIAVYTVYKKTVPIMTEAQIQMRRVSGQAKSLAAKASSTADIVHAQTQRLLGNAESTGSQVTRQARTVGAALTGVMVAARVMNFVRKVI